MNVIKGTGSRDKIQKFRQKRIVMGLNKSIFGSLHWQIGKYSQFIDYVGLDDISPHLLQ
jgi:hypothetical protein